MLETELALFDLSEVVAPWTPIYDNAMSFICRDCGRKNAWECGGGGAGGSYNLCRDCAALDGWNERRDGALNCSTWGIHTEPAAHEQLLAKRELRRARWTAAHAC